jgi:Leucine-rich repeat (LRR) protein
LLRLQASQFVNRLHAPSIFGLCLFASFASSPFCLSGKCVGDNLHSLNLSGTSIEKLPDDLMKCLPKLKSLKLNDCRALVFLPLSLAALEELEVADCSSLVYPPSSARQTPERVLQFLRDVDPTSEPWRRLKVMLSVPLLQLAVFYNVSQL